MDIETQTHSFSVGVACKVGINAAIMVQNIYFWVTKNEANGKSYHDGRYWTYNSVKAFSELFPYMSKGQIDGALKKLEAEGYIVSGNYNQSKYDRTKWYALTDAGYALVEGDKSISKNQEMEKAESRNRNKENCKPIPDIKTYSKQDNKPKEVSRFVPPSIEEVADYIHEMGYSLDSQEFLDANEQSGWRLKGGQPVKDWRARVRTFERYRKQRGGTSQYQAAQSRPKMMQHTPEEEAEPWGWWM